MFTSENPTVEMIGKGLSSLTAEELKELDAIITPRAALLLIKAFGEEMWHLLAPLTENDPPQEKAAVEDELRALMRAPRYWRDRDPSIMKKVGEGFGALYPQPVQ